MTGKDFIDEVTRRQSEIQSLYRSDRWVPAQTKQQELEAFRGEHAALDAEIHSLARDPRAIKLGLQGQLAPATREYGDMQIQAGIANGTINKNPSYDTFVYEPDTVAAAKLINNLAVSNPNAFNNLLAGHQRDTTKDLFDVHADKNPITAGLYMAGQYDVFASEKPEGRVFKNPTIDVGVSHPELQGTTLRVAFAGSYISNPGEAIIPRLVTTDKKTGKDVPMTARELRDMIRTGDISPRTRETIAEMYNELPPSEQARAQNTVLFRTFADKGIDLRQATSEQTTTAEGESVAPGIVTKGPFTLPGDKNITVNFAKAMQASPMYQKYGTKVNWQDVLSGDHLEKLKKMAGAEWSPMLPGSLEELKTSSSGLELAAAAALWIPGLIGLGALKNAASPDKYVAGAPHLPFMKPFAGTRREQSKVIAAEQNFLINYGKQIFAAKQNLDPARPDINDAKANLSELEKMAVSRLGVVLKMQYPDDSAKIDAELERARKLIDPTLFSGAVKGGWTPGGTPQVAGEAAAARSAAEWGTPAPATKK